MLLPLDSQWQNILSDEIQKPYFHDLMNAVDDEYNKFICFPPKDFIFAAFEYCSFQDLKVVIIGQDPYHGAGEANGLCFSVNDNIKIPPSLRNIYREVNDDLDTIFLPTSGNLNHWAKQGILLLNDSLTVRKDEAHSHKHLNWNRFTHAVIQKISDDKENIVFLLWGAFAQKKGKIIDKNKHLVLECGHPSFANAHKKWFGNKHFSKANLYLEENGKSPIKWNSNL